MLSKRRNDWFYLVSMKIKNRKNGRILSFNYQYPFNVKNELINILNKIILETACFHTI